MAKFRQGLRALTNLEYVGGIGGDRPDKVDVTHLTMATLRPGGVRDCPATSNMIHITYT